MVITNPDSTTTTFPQGFTIEEGRTAQVWVDIIGRNTIGLGRGQTFYIVYGNRGNIDANGPVLFVAVPKEAAAKIPRPSNPTIPLGGVNWDVVPLSVETETELWFPRIIYKLAPGEVRVLTLTLTVFSAENLLRAWITAPLFPNGFQAPGGALLRSTQSDDTDHRGIEESIEAASRQVGYPDPALVDYFEYRRQLREGIKEVGQSLAEEGAKHYGIEFGWTLVVLGAVGIAVFGLGAAWVPTAAIAVVLISIPTWVEFHEGAMLIKRALVVRGVRAFDPNAKVGSLGVAEPQYLSGEEPLRYAVFFENVETATAPAQEVLITDQLDATKIDLSTLNLGPISFGDQLVVPPSGLSAFTTTVDLRPKNNLLVKIEASLDASTGLLTWRFTSIDPATGQLPEDPLLGFLPPNVNPLEGEGSVLFTVMPKKDLPTGTEIRNSASIVFDVNPPIDTPEWLNTLDSTKPSSHVLPLAATQNSASFQVQWAGTDVGSGILDYTIFVSENGGPFTEWLSNTSDTSAMFPGEAGKTYAFYSVVRDQTGNLEDAPPVADATTTVSSITVTVLKPNGGQTWPIGTTKTIRWTSTGVSGDVKIQLSRNGGTTWKTLFADTPNDGTQTWKVKGKVTTRARIRVQSLANTTIADSSDSNFTIKGLTVLSPNNGEVWSIGSTQTIRWKSVGVGEKVQIQLSRDDGANWTTIVDNTANDGAEDWIMAGPMTTQARIRVLKANKPTIQDSSNKSFTIQ
ncbi:MAG: hypothetical protein HY268_23230 [Deltaproteobacteria bacterium]|nr:hypothetical protein [Deltaproteobacteria bacterium]